MIVADFRSIKEFTTELMQRLGYGGQPYILFRHNDIDREHYHVVSIRTDIKGKKINDSFEHRRCLQAQLELSDKYGFTVGLGKAENMRYVDKRVMQNVINSLYKYANNEEHFTRMLNRKNIYFGNTGKRFVFYDKKTDTKVDMKTLNLNFSENDLIRLYRLNRKQRLSNNILPRLQFNGNIKQNISQTIMQSYSLFNVRNFDEYRVLLNAMDIGILSDSETFAYYGIKSGKRATRLFNDSMISGSLGRPELLRMWNHNSGIDFTKEDREIKRLITLAVSKSRNRMSLDRILSKMSMNLFQDEEKLYVIDNHLKRVMRVDDSELTRKISDLEVPEYRGYDTGAVVSQDSDSISLILAKNIISLIEYEDYQSRVADAENNRMKKKRKNKNKQI